MRAPERSGSGVWGQEVNRSCWKHLTRNFHVRSGMCWRYSLSSNQPSAAASHASLFIHCVRMRASNMFWNMFWNGSRTSSADTVASDPSPQPSSAVWSAAAADVVCVPCRYCTPPFPVWSPLQPPSAVWFVSAAAVVCVPLLHPPCFCTVPSPCIAGCCSFLALLHAPP